MTFDQLSELIREKRSCLCVGLDPEPKRLPASILRYDMPLFEFCRRIVEATAPYAVAYKINTAFFEAEGSLGWECLERLQAYIGPRYFRIADAKRGDIGNTAYQYARAFFERMDFDALTLSPYMGPDSLEPFFSYPEKSAFVLGLTSNNGAHFIQTRTLNDGSFIFEYVIHDLCERFEKDKLGFVVGATQDKELINKVLKTSIGSFYLVPGVGVQGASLLETLQLFKTVAQNLLINSSRDILYASTGEDFAEKAGEKASEMARTMAEFYKEIFNP
jgi:orotidine-5'-phosphate decarboxylase